MPCATASLPAEGEMGSPYGTGAVSTDFRRAGGCGDSSSPISGTTHQCHGHPRDGLASGESELPPREGCQRHFRFVGRPARTLSRAGSDFLA